VRALRAQAARLGIASAVGSRRGNSLEVLVRSQVEDQREIRHRSGVWVPGQGAKLFRCRSFLLWALMGLYLGSSVPSMFLYTHDHVALSGTLNDGSC
jgi:hypothetical protein